VKILDNKENYITYSKSVPNHQTKRVSLKVLPLDQQLSSFVKKANQVNLPISLSLIQSVARENANDAHENFKASIGFFDKFRKRHSIKRQRLHGEAGSVDDERIKKWIIENSSQLLLYDKKDVYNCDETGLEWRKLNDHTYVHSSFQGQLSGIKSDKSRITILNCVSLTGEKKKLLVIGKHSKPQCFKQFNYDTSKLPVIYKANKTAWMNSAIFNEWIDIWNEELAQENRKILLLADNFSGHTNYNNKTSNIDILFLPPNTTSKSQPLDAGIIKSFKDRYKKLFHDSLYKNITENNIDLSTALRKYSLLDAIRNAVDAWNSITSSAITNCWSHTKIVDIYDNCVEMIEPDHSYSIKD